MGLVPHEFERGCAYDLYLGLHRRRTWNIWRERTQQYRLQSPTVARREVPMECVSIVRYGRRGRPGSHAEVSGSNDTCNHHYTRRRTGTGPGGEGPSNDIVSMYRFAAEGT